jgi:hypothetical protein
MATAHQTLIVRTTSCVLVAAAAARITPVQTRALPHLLERQVVVYSAAVTNTVRIVPSARVATLAGTTAAAAPTMLTAQPALRSPPQ